jgi:16S rRNA processing protein RimM
MEGKQISRNEYLLRLDGVNDRDTAMKLRDHILYSRVEERPKLLSDDEYLVSDLVGMHVMLLQKDGQRHDPQISPNIGKISGIVLAEEMCSISGLGNDLLEVLLPEKRWEASKWRDHFVLVPFVPAICPVVDLENKVIYIDPPTGLLDLSYAHEENRAIKGFLPGSAE